MIKVAINNDYLLKDYTEESFPHSMIIEFDYQEIMLEDKYKECIHEDFDFINSQYQFNPVKFTARMTIEKQNRYGQIVEQKIRKKYTLSEELALHRQKEAKPSEWETYYKYCERCKAEARQEEGM